MGGQKKRSISQMEKAQVIQEKKKEKPKTKGQILAESKQRGVDMPNINDPKFLSQISKFKVLTPYSMSSQLNLKISSAKKLLRELEKKKVVTSVEGNSRIRVYQVTSR